MNEITVFKTGYGELLSKSVEESIRSVFMASIKMAAFYGFYTWLIHHIFGVSIAYLPSIFASIFGFLPILSTYWVSLPGVLELWLLQNQPFLSILFFICHVSPTYIVDTSIYSEIKGGHPYFTGLAIAGGIYCIGLEGALIGPIILCLFIVIIRMNKEILMKTTD
jgi:predicted PurR-regulated permease PerM